MHKHLFFLSTFLLTGFAGFSQVEIHAAENGQPVGSDLSGTIVSIEVTSNEAISRSYLVTNTSGSVQQLQLQRVIVSETAGWTNSVSWAPHPDPNFAGMCFAPAQMPSNPWTTPNTVQLNGGEQAIMIPVVNPNSAGCGHYRYKLMNGNTVVDSMDLEVCYTLGFGEEEGPSALEAYPNPASDYLEIVLPGLTGAADLLVTDMSGKVVYAAKAGSANTIDVGDFENGIYLVTVRYNGQAVQTQRVAIRH